MEVGNFKWKTLDNYGGTEKTSIVLAPYICLSIRLDNCMVHLPSSADPYTAG